LTLIIKSDISKKQKEGVSCYSFIFANCINIKQAGFNSAIPIKK